MKKRSNTVTIYLTAIGNNIRKERKKKGLTLAALGEDIGLDKGNLQRIEQGKNITLITLAKISAFLEINPTRLFARCGDIRIEDAELYIKKSERKS
jgi:transcriptional regulator with XRE-family HTH domain